MDPIQLKEGCGLPKFHYVMMLSPHIQPQKSQEQISLPNIYTIFTKQAKFAGADTLSY